MLQDDTPVHTAALEAAALLRRTEEELRTLLNAALGTHTYSDVAIYAQIADELVAIRNRWSTTEGRQVNTGTLAEQLVAIPNSRPIPETAVSSRKSRPEYPKFHREGERLVKTGWSKKDRKEYQHNTPFSVVEAVAAALRSTTGKFSMDELLPIQDSTGSTVPSYQAYIVVAWLRQNGAVERIGNNGYITQSDALRADMITRLWNALPTR